MRSGMWIAVTCMLMGGCASAGGPGPMDTPSEALRHRAALATVLVTNATTSLLTIAFRTANPPVQEVIIGRMAAGDHGRLAPIPASEPIVLIARRADGAELVLESRSFALDSEWTWEIPRDATFVKPLK